MEELENKNEVSDIAAGQEQNDIVLNKGQDKNDLSVLSEERSETDLSIVPEEQNENGISAVDEIQNEKDILSSVTDRYEKDVMNFRYDKLIIKHINLEDGFRVLDVGCCDGSLLDELSKIKKIECIGFDSSAVKIATAMEKYPDMNVRLCSYEQMPCEDESVDVIVASLAFFSFPHKGVFAREAHRVLKNGGRIYISEPRLFRSQRKRINDSLAVYGNGAEYLSPLDMQMKLGLYGFKKVGTFASFLAKLLVFEKSGEITVTPEQEKIVNRVRTKESISFWI